MNTQELKEQVSSLPSELIFKKVMVNKDSVLKLIDQLDEPQEVVIPPLIANYIVHCQSYGMSLARVLVDIESCCEDYVAINVQDWISRQENQETFARAWLDGYEVEQEKLYTVEVVGTGQYLVERYKKQGYVFIDTEDPLLFTKSELEKAGFGWVFDCNGVKVEEVE